MIPQEWAEIAGLLNAAYKTSGGALFDDTKTVNAWFLLLEDLDGRALKAAAINLITKSPYSPKISDLRAEYVRITTPDVLPDLEAWAVVRDGIRNGLYGATEEFAKMPPDVQKAVGSADSLTEWAMLKPEQVETVIQSQFLTAYRAQKERRHNDSVIGRIGAKNGAFAALVADTVAKLEEKTK